MAAGSDDRDRRAKTHRALSEPAAFVDSHLLRTLRLAGGLALFALVALAIAHYWDGVRPALGRIGAFDLLVAVALVVLGLLGSALTWRAALRELGSTARVGTASKIYLVGQLGKYIPGSLWALAVQMELANSAGVPRARGFTASLVAIGVNTVTGLALGLLVLRSVAESGFWLAVAVAAVLAVVTVALAPPVLTRMLDLGLRVLRRPRLERAVTWRGILEATGWSVGSWISYGVSVWLLAIAVGAPAAEALPLCIGGIALGTTLGVLAVVAPSGIGIREAVLVAALAPVLARPEGLAVALAARLVFSTGDLLAAAITSPVRVGASRA